MRLYYHPLSTTCRPVLFFAADNGINLELQVVDIMTGEHLKEPYSKINPSCLVPVLEDGDFRLTESSSILKYLADKIGSPAYPKDLKKRARVNEMMDWFNTGFYREFGYGLIYPQILPPFQRSSDEQQAGVIQWGKNASKRWLHVLDQSLIGPKKSYVCGEEITIADYFGAPIVTLGETIGCDFSKYPNITRWLNGIKARPNWFKINEGFYGMVGALKSKTFETI